MARATAASMGSAPRPVEPPAAPGLLGDSGVRVGRESWVAVVDEAAFHDRAIEPLGGGLHPRVAPRKLDGGEAALFHRLGQERALPRVVGCLNDGERLGQLGDELGCLDRRCLAV